MIRSESGMIAIRSEQRAYSAADFALIPVILGPQGERVLLGDIAPPPPPPGNLRWL